MAPANASWVDHFPIDHGWAGTNISPMTLRLPFRLVWFAFDVTIIFINYARTAAFVPKATKRLARAQWLHRSCNQNFKVYNCNVTYEGQVPTSGLLVSNHLSYLDILVLSSISPAVFVSKAEVQSWPIFGWLAKLAGTVFIERTKRMDVGPVNEAIETAMIEGVMVVVFPEGTSTNGETLLPFRSSLLEPAAGTDRPIAVCHIEYELDDGDARNEVCYWGDHSFVPHLMNLMSKKGVRAKVRFGTFQKTTDDRKELAVQLREAVLKLKSAQ